MAKKKRANGGTSEDAPLSRLLVPRAEFETELADRISKGESLLEWKVRSQEDYDRLREDYNTWNEFNRDLLLQRFSGDTPSSEYVRESPTAYPMGMTVQERADYLTARIREKVRRLRSIAERLSLYDEDEVKPTTAGAHTGEAPRGIFLVHGHNTAAREEVARFLDRVTPEGATILHEQANQGQVLLEKFEKHGGTSAFAVVLLTGDDEGRLRSNEEGEQPLQPRARQNVVFELGFFVGALGRDRVAVLHEDGVELPSDLHGLAYIPYPQAEWRVKLARELRDAGIDIDTDRLL